MDVVIRLGVRIEMHWPLFSIGTLQLNSSRRAAWDAVIKLTESAGRIHSKCGALRHPV